MPCCQEIIQEGFHLYPQANLEIQLPTFFIKKIKGELKTIFYWRCSAFDQVDGPVSAKQKCKLAY